MSHSEHSLPPVIAAQKSMQKSVKFDWVTSNRRTCFYGPPCNSICC